MKKLKKIQEFLQEDSDLLSTLGAVGAGENYYTLSQIQDAFYEVVDQDSLVDGTLGTEVELSDDFRYELDDDVVEVYWEGFASVIGTLNLANNVFDAMMEKISYKPDEIGEDESYWSAEQIEEALSEVDWNRYVSADKLELSSIEPEIEPRTNGNRVHLEASVDPEDVTLDVDLDEIWSDIESSLEYME